MTDPNVAPPLFTAAHGGTEAPAPALRGDAGNLNLDDIFGDVVFTPEGDTVFLSEQAGEEEILNSGEAQVKMGASRPDERGHFNKVQQGGGLATTQLGRDGLPALAMGTADAAAAPTKHVPFRHDPQAGHHLQYAAPKKKKSSRGGNQSERRYVFSFADYFNHA